jgi:hypothetical protein
MWTLIKGLLLKWEALLALLKSLGSLGIFLPIALLLKALGLKTLIILAILALPILIVLLILGLPLLLVFFMGSLLLGLIGSALSVGFAVLKIVLPIVLVVWVIRWLWGRDHHGPRPAEGEPPKT